MSKVTVSETAKAIQALMTERDSLVREAEHLNEQAKDHKEHLERISTKHRVVLAKQIAIEEAVAKMLKGAL